MKFLFAIFLILSVHFPVKSEEVISRTTVSGQEISTEIYETYIDTVEQYFTPTLLEATEFYEDCHRKVEEEHPSEKGEYDVESDFVLTQNHAENLLNELLMLNPGEGITHLYNFVENLKFQFELWINSEEEGEVKEEISSHLTRLTEMHVLIYPFKDLKDSLTPCTSKEVLQIISYWTVLICKGSVVKMLYGFLQESEEEADLFFKFAQPHLEELKKDLAQLEKQINYYILNMNLSRPAPSRTSFKKLKSFLLPLEDLLFQIKLKFGEELLGYPEVGNLYENSILSIHQMVERVDEIVSC